MSHHITHLTDADRAVREQAYAERRFLRHLASRVAAEVTGVRRRLGADPDRADRAVAELERVAAVLRAGRRPDPLTLSVLTQAYGAAEVSAPVRCRDLSARWAANATPTRPLPRRRRAPRR